MGPKGKKKRSYFRKNREDFYTVITLRIFLSPVSQKSLWPLLEPIRYRDSWLWRLNFQFIGIASVPRHLGGKYLFYLLYFM